MGFRYHPPTRTKCTVCDQLHQTDQRTPLIDTHNGKASSANNFPFHNWYNFVLGYTPAFPELMLEREKISPTDLIVDPFMGSGTTLVACKWRGIPSQGLDANNFMVQAAQVKLNWNINFDEVKRHRDRVLGLVEDLFSIRRRKNPPVL